VSHLAKILVITNLILHTKISTAAPITFNTALPVSKNELIFREQFILSNSSSSETYIQRSSLISSIALGLNSSTALFVSLPLTYTSIDSPNKNTSSKGIGDIRITSRYTSYREDKAGKTFRIAPIFGVELASSQVDFENSTNDIFTGIVLTYANTNRSIDGQISYHLNGSNGETKLGNAINFDASLQYRLLPKTFTANTSAFLNGSIEVNIIKQNQNRIAKNSRVNSGGTSFFLSPGLQYITQHWIIEGNIQIPLINNDNPIENNYSARFGVRVNI